MKCRRCREPAVIDVRRHNAGFCAPCFTRHCGEQVRRAIEDHDMIARNDRVLVAVSGGKDSLGLWQLLRELGYEADGLYVGLGIGEYSDQSGDYARAFAEAHGWPLLEIDLRDHVRFRRSRSGEGDPPGSVLGVRALEAARVQRRGDRERIQRARHRSQSRRRSRRCCSATCCDGTRAISAANSRCCPRRRASCAR